MILDISNAISPKRYKIGTKFVLITNRKSHMTFQLVPNSMTLDDLEGRNSPYRRVISPNSVAFGADYVKVVEDTLGPKLMKLNFCRFIHVMMNDEPYTLL